MRRTLSFATVVVVLLGLVACPLSADDAKKANEIRESYVQDVLSMRTKADEIAQTWTKLAADDEINKSLDKVNAALGTKFALKPSSSFAANIKQLKTMEEAVSSEAIKLDN